MAARVQATGGNVGIKGLKSPSLDRKNRPKPIKAAVGAPTRRRAMVRKAIAFTTTTIAPRGAPPPLAVKRRVQNSGSSERREHINVAV
jgi:hypothetical protein